MRTAELFSMAMVSLIPITLVGYRLVYPSQPDLAALICRPTLLCVSIALFMMCGYGSGLAAAEKSLIRVLVILCSTLLITSLLATDPARAMQEWFKLALISVIAVTLCRPLMNPATSRIFGAAMVLSSIVLGGLIVATYIRYMGLVVPTYPAIRVLKGSALDDGNIALNPLGFECVFTFLCGMCLIRGNRFLWSIGAFLLVISSVLTGSRAPLAVFMISALVLLILNGLQSHSQSLRGASLLLAITLPAAAVVLISSMNFQQLSSVTEGRWDLWSTAVHKFSMHPLWGNGYLSVMDDPSFLPGGYHNEYLTALAEQGVFGFAAVMCLFIFLLRHCWKIAFTPASPSCNGQVVLFACLFLTLRALVELPGLFGTAQGPADFLAYIFLAIAVSRTPNAESLPLVTPEYGNGGRLPFLTRSRAGITVSRERIC